MSHISQSHLSGPIRFIALACLLCMQCLAAFGSLGGTLDSVQLDQAKMMATVESANGHGYTVHEMKSPTGVVVREYVSSSGRVFGVAWEGPFLPDLKQLFGSYFSQFSTAAKAHREARLSHRFLIIREPGLVVETSGHMRAYSGRAYDPGLLPDGVNGNDVR